MTAYSENNDCPVGSNNKIKLSDVHQTTAMTDKCDDDLITGCYNGQNNELLEQSYNKSHDDNSQKEEEQVFTECNISKEQADNVNPNMTEIHENETKHNISHSTDDHFTTTTVSETTLQSLSDKTEMQKKNQKGKGNIIFMVRKRLLKTSAGNDFIKKRRKNAEKKNVKQSNGNVELTAKGKPRVKHVCDVCQNVYYNKGHLVRHKLSHNEELRLSNNELKIFRCPQCDKKYSTAFLLKKHVATHSGGVMYEKKFTCEYCGNSFCSSTHLAVHFRTHTGERPYACEHCEKAFIDRSTLLRHVKTVHFKEKGYICHECGKSFSQSSHLKGHILTHSTVRPHGCSKCSKRYSDPRMLKRHLKYHASNPNVKSRTSKASDLLNLTKKSVIQHVENASPLMCNPLLNQITSVNMPNTVDSSIETYSSNILTKNSASNANSLLQQGIVNLLMSREQAGGRINSKRPFSGNASETLTDALIDNLAHQGLSPFVIADESNNHATESGNNFLTEITKTNPLSGNTISKKNNSSSSRVENKIQSLSSLKLIHNQSSPTGYIKSSSLSVSLNETLVKNSNNSSISHENVYNNIAENQNKINENYGIATVQDSYDDVSEDDVTAQTDDSQFDAFMIPSSRSDPNIITSYPEQMDPVAFVSSPTVNVNHSDPNSVSGMIATDKIVDTALSSAVLIQSITGLMNTEMHNDNSDVEPIDKGEFGKDVKIKQEIIDSVNENGNGNNLDLDNTHNGNWKESSCVNFDENTSIIKLSEMKHEVEDGSDTDDYEYTNDNTDANQGTKTRNVALKSKTKKKLAKNGGRKKKDFICDTCGKKFTQSAILTVHIRTHTGEKPFVCHICEKGFIDRSTLNRHINVHTGARKFSCDECGKCFTQSGHLRFHMRSVHSNEKNFQCEFCDKAFSTKRYLTLHLSQHSDDKSAFTCDKCGKSFKWLNSLKSHEVKHGGETKYNCDICNKPFLFEFELKRHKVSHSDMRPYDCKLCDKKYKEQRYLTIHMMEHTGERPYICDVCGKGYTQQRTLKTHQLTHFKKDDEMSLEMAEQFKKKDTSARKKRCVCTVCNQMFRDKGVLKLHMRRHTGERPFPCQLCTKAFATAYRLKVHILTHSDDKPFVCLYCSKGFTQRCHLRTHILVHQDTTPFQCPMCNKYLTSQTTLDDHLRTHSGEKPFECPICFKRFTQRTNWSAHKSKHRNDEKSDLAAAHLSSKKDELD